MASLGRCGRLEVLKQSSALILGVPITLYTQTPDQPPQRTLSYLPLNQNGSPLFRHETCLLFAYCQLDGKSDDETLHSKHWQSLISTADIVAASPPGIRSSRRKSEKMRLLLCKGVTTSTRLVQIKGFPTAGYMGMLESALAAMILYGKHNTFDAPGWQRQP